MRKGKAMVSIFGKPAALHSVMSQLNMLDPCSCADTKLIVPALMMLRFQMIWSDQ